MNSEVLEAYVSLRREVALLRAAATKDLDFGHNQISILYRLSLSDAAMGELADYALTDKASITRAVASLEKNGFVKRATDKTDRRISRIGLTAKGRAQAKKAQEIRRSIGKQLNDSLNPAERQQFSALAYKIVQNLKAKQETN